MTFRREQRLRTLTYVLLVVAFIGIAWQVNSTRNLANKSRAQAVQGKEAHDAICTLKADIRQRIADSEKFLHDHRGGIAGIPASVIKTSIKNQRSTLKALKLSCPTDPLPGGIHP